ncbi:MAG TPA: GAF domain-containing SpoIIE family protein phosphatase, partial [Candidatus Saccharimonadales bacterium]|nr:GAF domain-containing SpoIIE family protein phosphatase [Candidatus Saccharimonadales bacterium]
SVVIDDTPVGQETTTYTISVDEVITRSSVFSHSSDVKATMDRERGAPSSGARRAVSAPRIEAGLDATHVSADASAGDRTLAVLTRAGMELINHRPYDEILNVIMDLVFEAMPAERGFLMLLEGEENRMVHKAVRDLTRSSGGAISLSRSIANMVIQNRQSVLTSDAQRDERFRMRESVVLQGIRSAMCVPLWNNKEVTGLVYVDTVNSTKPFGPEDLKLLTLLANVAAVKLENLRLVQSTIERERLEREIEQAADIQQRLLPPSTVELQGYDVFGHADACRAVGGDYFDFLKLSGGRFAMVIGDVSGKGMAAALLMASMQAIFRTLADVEASPARLLGSLNRHLVKSANPNKFASFFLGSLDPASGSLLYVNAGHNPPILLRSDGNVERLPAGGVVLGVFEDAPFEEKSVTLNPGDILTMYSDGVTEQVDPKDEEFGEERLIATVKENASLTAQEVHAAVLKALLEFEGEAPQYDDATLVVLKRHS